MPLLLAALLAAASAADEEAQIADFTVAAGGGTRGERRAEASAKAGISSLWASLGAAESQGPRAPLRQEILLAAQAGIARADLRVVPGSGDLTRLSGELGVHFETLGLIVGGRTASLGRTQMNGAGARLELEGELREGLRAGLSAAFWLLSLQAPPRRDPWNAFGMSTLDWPQRAEIGLWTSEELGAVSLAPSLSLSLPAQPGSFESRAALALEIQLGPVRARAEAAVARQTGPLELWMMDVSAGATMSLR